MPRSCLVSGEFTEGLEGALRPSLLERPYESVKKDDDEDDYGVGSMVEREGDGSGHDEEVDKTSGTSWQLE